MSVLLISLPAAYISSYLKCKGMHKAARELSSLQVLFMCCWMFKVTWTMDHGSQDQPTISCPWHQWAHLGTVVFNYPDIWLLSRSMGFPRDSPKSLFSIRKVSRSYRSWSRRLQLLVRWDVRELRVVEQKRGEILILIGEWWVETLEIIPGYKESSRKKRVQDCKWHFRPFLLSLSLQVGVALPLQADVCTSCGPGDMQCPAGSLLPTHPGKITFRWVFT